LSRVCDTVAPQFGGMPMAGETGWPMRRRRQKQQRTPWARIAAIGVGLHILTGVAGATTAYMFDPSMGRTRRAKLRDRLAGSRHRALRRARRGARYAWSETAGLARRGIHALSWQPAEVDDVTLAHRVESTVLRDRDIPKDRLTIGAEDGIVVLRGAVGSAAEIRKIESAVRHVHGVNEVRNLLHIEGTMAPNKAEVLLHERGPFDGGDRH
jgi:hypothetical protein